MENKINTLTKCLAEKDSTIKNLEQKLQNVSEKNTVEIEERFRKVERRAFVLEKTKLGNEFCEFCEEEFESNSNLKIHTRFTYTFDCEICGISFETLTDLEIHMHSMHCILVKDLIVRDVS